MGRARRLHDELHRLKDEAHQGRGTHRRSETARQAILQAADDLLVERGFGGVTVEGIAARAGVGKQTIYRWWRSKTAVLMDSFIEDAAEEMPLPDTGRLDEDLRQYLRQVARFLTRADAGVVLRTLLGEAQHDHEVAQMFRDGYLRHQRHGDRLLLTRAMARGELSGETDIDAALDRLVGPVYYRVLVSGDPVGPKFTDGVVAAFLAGSAAP